MSVVLIAVVVVVVVVVVVLVLVLIEVIGCVSPISLLLLLTPPPLPLSETIDTLSRPQSDVWGERDRRKREQEKRAMDACTFRPRLCKGTEKRVQVSSSSSSINLYCMVTLSLTTLLLILLQRGDKTPVPERLLQHQEATAISRIQTKYELEQAQLQECTFRPAINPDSVAIVEDKNYRPIYERLGELQVRLLLLLLVLLLMC